MAWAQQQLGDLPAAFAHRRAVFEESANFEDYLAALELARQVDEPPQSGRGYRLYRYHRAQGTAVAHRARQSRTA